MSKNQHNPNSTQFTQNQNNQMSEGEMGDGSRNSKTLGRDGKPTPVERPPQQGRQNEPTTKTFEEEGAGVAPKE
jgi:hypothetical protein